MASIARIDKNGKTDEQRRKDALKWLSIVRQTTPDVQTVVAYELGLRDLPVAAVEQAVKDIGMAQRGEYEHAWPELGTIRARVASILRMQQEREEDRARKQLMPPEPSPARKAEFLKKLRELIDSKSMK